MEYQLIPATRTSQIATVIDGQSEVLYVVWSVCRPVWTSGFVGPDECTLFLIAVPVGVVVYAVL